MRNANYKEPKKDNWLELNKIARPSHFGQMAFCSFGNIKTHKCHGVEELRTKWLFCIPGDNSPHCSLLRRKLLSPKMAIMQPLGCKENPKCLPLREMLGAVLPCLLCLKRVYESYCRTQAQTSIADSHTYPSWKLQHCIRTASLQCNGLHLRIAIHSHGMDGMGGVKETQIHSSLSPSTFDAGISNN